REPGRPARTSAAGRGDGRVHRQRGRTWRGIVAEPNRATHAGPSATMSPMAHDSSGSLRAILTALGANLGIAVAKTAAAVFATAMPRLAPSAVRMARSEPEESCAMGDIVAEGPAWVARFGSATMPRHVRPRCRCTRPSPRPAALVLAGRPGSRGDRGAADPLAACADHPAGPGSRPGLGGVRLDDRPALAGWHAGGGPARRPGAAGGT